MISVVLKKNLFHPHREFTMAEIEHFCDPADKSHPKFGSVRDLEVTLYSACNQMDGKLPQRRKIGDAVAEVPRTYFEDKS